MEPLDEHELKHLLACWEAPPAPSTLRASVLRQPVRWWQWFISGTIRVPVPVGMAAIVLLMIYFYSRISAPSKAVLPQPEQPALMTGFKPVDQLTPVIIRRPNESNAKEK